MKRKIFSILFALVLVLTLGLVTAVPVSANPGGIELVAIGDSTAEWTTEQAKVGSYSAKLTMPAGTGWVNDNAEVRIPISASLKISEITGWSYWTMAPDKYTTPIEFYVDTNNDGEYDKIIAGTKIGATPEGWFQVDKDYLSCYMTWKNGYEWLTTWDKVVAKYGDATLLRVDIGYGSLGSNQAVTAYIDDFTLNDTTYVFEPLPIEVEIDIKPGSDPNSINLKSKGVIPVAILTTPDFDATTVDGTTVKFGPDETGPVHDLSNPAVVVEHQQDVDGDGDIDYVFHFRTQHAGIAPGDTEATLTGQTYGGFTIEGTDSVRTIPHAF